MIFIKIALLIKKIAEKFKIESKVYDFYVCRKMYLTVISSYVDQIEHLVMVINSAYNQSNLHL